MSLFLAAFIAIGPQAPPPPQQPPPQACIAVVDAGSHAFRNIMLGGIAGALVSKKQYKVVAAKNYPAKVGNKIHGNDLQVIQAGGAKVIVMDKNMPDDAKAKACD